MSIVSTFETRLGVTVYLLSCGRLVHVGRSTTAPKTESPAVLWWYATVESPVVIILLIVGLHGPILVTAPAIAVNTNLSTASITHTRRPGSVTALSLIRIITAISPQVIHISIIVIT